MTIPAAIVALVGAGAGPRPLDIARVHTITVLVEAPQKKFASVIGKPLKEAAMRVCKILVRALAGLVIAGGMWVAKRERPNGYGIADRFVVRCADRDIAGRERAADGHREHSRAGTVTFTGAPTAEAAISRSTEIRCTGTLTAPTTCQVSVVYTASLPAGTLESATLTISSNATPASAFGADERRAMARSSSLAR